MHTSSFKVPARQTPRSKPLIACLAAVGILVAGCLSQPKPDAVFHDSPRGTVVLERLPEKNIQATHPIKLDSVVLRRILEGVRVKGPATAVQLLMADEAEVAPAFTADDVAFLTPLIAQALQTAMPEQHVKFSVVQPAMGLSSRRTGAGVGSSEPMTGLTTETTSGTLYVHGLSVHLTLTEYRLRPERGDTINMPNRRLPDPTGLATREVVFVPAAAKRSDTYKSDRLLGESVLTTLVIDYEKLGKLAVIPEQTLQPGMRDRAEERKPAADAAISPQSEEKEVSQEDYQSVKDLVIKKDMELEKQKKEIQSLRRQLEERDGRIETRKAKPSPKSAE